MRTETYLKDIDGRRLVFDVKAYDEFEKIAEEENEQIIVSVDRFLARIKSKKVETKF